DVLSEDRPRQPVAPVAVGCAHQAQLLDVPGDGGLGGLEAEPGQGLRHLLLGVQWAGLDQVQDRRLAALLVHPAPFPRVTWRMTVIARSTSPALRISGGTSRIVLSSV